MTHYNETEVEHDRRRSNELTVKLINKTIAKIIMDDAGIDDDRTACYGRMAFEFTDGTRFVLSELGQAGGMEYEVLPAASHLEQAMNAVIDNVIEQVLVDAGVSVLDDEDVVAYLNERTRARVITPEFKAYCEACRQEGINDTISFMQGIARAHVELSKFYSKK
jgi:hypothetical protein